MIHRSARRMRPGGRKTDGEQRGDQGSPSSGGNGLRPSLRSQLVALFLRVEIHVHVNRFDLYVICNLRPKSLLQAAKVHKERVWRNLI